MPASLLIDAIDEEALDASGDTLIDARADPPALYDEHSNVLAPLAHSLENPA